MQWTSELLKLGPQPDPKTTKSIHFMALFVSKMSLVVYSPQKGINPNYDVNATLTRKFSYGHGSDGQVCHNFI